jgi:hypothetical protein
MPKGLTKGRAIWRPQSRTCDGRIYGERENESNERAGENKSELPEAARELGWRWGFIRFQEEKDPAIPPPSRHTPRQRIDRALLSGEQGGFKEGEVAAIAHPTQPTKLLSTRASHLP